MATDTSLICGFDIALPLGRAKFLAALKANASVFNEVERSAYDALRDELVRVARKEGSMAKVAEYAAPLERFIGAAPVPAPVAQVTAAEEKGGEREAEKISLKDPVQIPDASPVVAAPAPQKAPVFMRHVHGPDVARIAVNASADVSAPVNLPVQEVMPDVPVSAPAPDAPKEETLPVPEPVQNLTTSLRDEVEVINESLIELGHGRAFQWLNDPKTGYREYMAELLSIRDVLNTPSLASDPKEIRARIERLKELAGTVRSKVSGAEASVVATPEVSAVPEKSAIDEKPIESVSVPPYAETPQSNVSQSGWATIADPSAVPEPAPVEPPVVPKPAPEPPAVPEPAPMPEPHKEEPLMVPIPEKQSAPAAQVATPDIAVSVSEPEADVLHTREIDAGLTDLLTRWLGTTGFLGFGDSGMKHPEWIIMQNMMVEDVLIDDGTLPQGLRPDTYKNLGENIRAWRNAYDLAVFERELVEHYIRRVVQAGMSQRA